MGMRVSGQGRTGGGEALGKSEAFLNFQERLSRVARVDRPVLLIGERGTDEIALSLAEVAETPDSSQLRRVGSHTDRI
jgi:hypothetical protein